LLIFLDVSFYHGGKSVTKEWRQEVNLVKNEGLNARLVAGGLVLSLLFGVSANAAITTFQGTPSPILNPVFGTLINFDDLATGVLLPANQYASLGVSSIINLENPLLGTYSSSQSQPNYVGTGIDVGWAADILITFANLRSKVGIGIADAATTFTVWGDNNTVLFTYLWGQESNYYQVFESTAYDIRALEIHSSFVAIDDLQFNARSVPDVGSAAMLLGLVFTGLGVLRRRLS
jgi:hypothetical protein